MRFWLTSLSVLLLACSSSSPSEEPGGTTPTPPTTTPTPPDPMPPVPPADPACTTLAESLQAGLDEARSAQKVQHAALAVATPRCGDLVVLSDDPKATVKATPDALWQVGSITKTFVSATVLNLADAGKLGLDDALAKYLPDFPNGQNITLRHILSHSSGIFDYLHAGEELGLRLQLHADEPISTDEIIAAAIKHPPNFEPGKGWSYSNTNYVILTRVIEKVTGEELGAAVRRGSIAKARLPHTFFASVEAVTEPLVPGFEGGYDVTKAYHPTWWGGAGAMQASPGALLTWAKTLYATDDVLSPAAKTTMETMLTTDTKSYRYGLGVMELSASLSGGNGIGLGHLGSVPGYMSELYHYPQTKLTIVALVSDSAGKPHELTKVAYAKVKELP